LAVVSSDGTSSALGALKVVSRPVSGGIAVVFTAAVFWWLLTLRSRQMTRERRPSKRSHPSSDQARWIAGLFISPGDDDPSLSLFQVFFWTVITVWGLAFVFLETGNLLSLTSQMMALLGIAGAGSVLARWIAMRSGGSTSQAPGGGGAADPSNGEFELWQMLSTNGQFDLLKLQILVFTLLIGAYVAWRIAENGAFPTLDDNTLLLLGVSQSVYLGGKLGATTSIAQAVGIKRDLDMQTAARADLEAERVKLQQRKDSGVATLALSPDETARLTALPGSIAVDDAKIADAKKKFTDALAALGLTGVTTQT
jgi:hypothetical protein